MSGIFKEKHNTKSLDLLEFQASTWKRSPNRRTASWIHWSHFLLRCFFYVMLHHLNKKPIPSKSVTGDITFHPLWQRLKHCFVLANGSRNKSVTLVWLEDVFALFIRYIFSNISTMKQDNSVSIGYIKISKIFWKILVLMAYKLFIPQHSQLLIRNNPPTGRFEIYVI